MKDYGTIIKGLRYCCGDENVTRVCRKCPYDKYPRDGERLCIDELMSEAADALVELGAFNIDSEEEA